MTSFTRAIGTGTLALSATLAISALSSVAYAQLNIGPIASLQSIGRTDLASVTAQVPGTTFGGTTVGGLSGLTYDRTNNRYYAISDDPGNATTTSTAARFYALNIDVADGTFGSGDVTFTSVTPLQQPGGGTFPLTAPLAIDPEGIALSPDGNSLWISSEGFRNAATPANSRDPFIRRYDLAGNQIGQLNLPSRYNIIGASDTEGPNNNLVFESLAFNASGNRLFTATEGGLRQDGGAATVSAGANSRILAFDPATGNRTAEYLYVTERIARPSDPAGAFATAGLVDILFTGDDTFLALERSLTTSPNTPSQTNEVRIYQCTLTGAQDISTIDSLGGGVAGTIAGIQKTLLFDFNSALFDGSQIRIDNLEAMTFGPQFADGSYSLIVASDDNFSANSPQTNQFFAFRVVVVPEAGTLPMMLGGAGCSVLGIVLARRRKRANG